MTDTPAAGPPEAPSELRRLRTRLSGGLAVAGGVHLADADGSIRARDLP